MRMNKLPLTYDASKVYEHNLYRKVMQVIVSVEQRHPQELLDRLVKELRQDIKQISPDKFWPPWP
jgi:hypothetical protein